MDDHATKQSRDVIRYRFFSAPRIGFVWSRKQLLDRCDETRREAASFINNEVGADNLIAVSESNWGETFGFGVSVWYRDGLTSKPKQAFRDFD